MNTELPFFNSVSKRPPTIGRFCSVIRLGGCRGIRWGARTAWAGESGRASAGADTVRGDPDGKNSEGQGSVVGMTLWEPMRMGEIEAYGRGATCPESRSSRSQTQSQLTSDEVKDQAWKGAHSGAS